LKVYWKSLFFHPEQEPLMSTVAMLMAVVEVVMQAVSLSYYLSPFYHQSARVFPDLEHIQTHHLNMADPCWMLEAWRVYQV
jgi:hypothetical protein